MAKQVFLTNVFATRHRGNNDACLDGTARWWKSLSLVETRLPGANSTLNTATGVTGTSNGIEVAAATGIKAEWLSEPLSADFTIAGTITVNLWALEVAMTDNIAINATVFKVDGATGVLTQIAKTARVTELGTSQAANNFTVVPTTPTLEVVDGSQSAGTPFQGTSLGDTAAHQRLAQSFVPTVTSLIQAVQVNCRRFNAVTDNLNLTIQTDNAGSPSGTVIASGSVVGSTLINSGSGADATFTLASAVTLSVGTTYWLVLERSGAVNSSLYYGVSTFGGIPPTAYAGGGIKVYASGSWGSFDVDDIRFATLRYIPTVKRGDRIRIVVWGDDVGGFGATTSSFTFAYDAATAAATGDSWVQFTEDLTFEPDGNPGQILLAQTNTVGGQTFGLTTNNFAALGQSFVASKATLATISAWIAKGINATDNLIVEIQTDSAGAPSGTVVSTIATIAAASLTTTATKTTWTPNLALTVSQTYWLVFRRSGSLSGTSGDSYLVSTSPGAVSGWTALQRQVSGSWAAIGTTVLACELTFPFSVSTYYLTNTAETITPGTASLEKKALTTRGSVQSNLITNTATGPTAGILLGGATTIEWFTPPLEAITFGGKAKFNIRAKESANTINASLRAEIAICNGDGSGAVVWGIADVEAITTNGSAGELPIVDGAIVAWVSGDDFALTAGQRLRFRILVDDSGDAPLVTGGSVTVSYNGTTASAAGDTYVLLPLAVTEQVTGPQTYFGVTTSAYNFGAVTQGQRKTFSSLAQSFTFGAVIAGSRKVFSQLTASFLFLKDVAGQRKTFSQLTAPFSFSKDVRGQRKTFSQISFPITVGIITAGIRVAFTRFGVVAFSVIFSKDVQGQRKAFGQTATSITFIKDIKGQKKTFGQTATSIIFTKDVLGQKKTFGQVATPFLFSKDVRGQKKTFGQTAFPINITIATAGIRVAFTRFGVVSLSVTFIKDIQGQRKTFGQTATSIIFSKDVLGEEKIFGQTAFPITVGITTAGIRVGFTQYGITSLSVTFTKDIRGQRTAFGQITMPVTFAKDVRGYRKVFGQIAFPITFIKDIKGSRKLFGQIVFPITFIKDVDGRRKVVGQIAFPITFIKDILGQRKTFGQLLSPFLFAKDVRGQRKVFGQTTFPINITIATAGIRIGLTRFGVIALPVIFSKDVNGQRKTFGQLLSPFLFSKDVRGQKKTFGQTTFPINVSITSAGILSGNAKYGSVSFPVAFVKDVKGQRKTFSQTATPITFIKDVAGRRKTFGQIAFPIVFTKEALGQKFAFGQLSMQTLFGKEVAARRKTFSQVTVPLIFLKDVIGRRKTFSQVVLPANVTIVVDGFSWLAAQTRYGSLTMPLTFSKEVIARRKTFGQLLSPILFAKDVRGQRKAFSHTSLPIVTTIVVAGKRVGFQQYGVIALPMTFTKDVRGRRKTFGQVTAPFLFGEVAQGWRHTFSEFELPINFEALVESGRVDAHGFIELELVLTMDTNGDILIVGVILNDALNLYLGEQDVLGAYVGSEQVWP